MEINPTNRDVDAIFAIKNFFTRDVLAFLEDRLENMIARAADTGMTWLDVQNAWQDVDREVRANLLPKQVDLNAAKAEELVRRVEKAFEQGHVMFAVARPDSEIFDVHCPCGVQFTAVEEELRNATTLRMAHDDATRETTIEKVLDEEEAAAQVREWGDQAASEFPTATHNEDGEPFRCSDPGCECQGADDEDDPIMRAPDFVDPVTQEPAKGPFDFDEAPPKVGYVDPTPTHDLSEED